MPDAITLRYDPLLLPTAQHRAGLAGLLTLRRSLDVRRVGSLPEYAIDADGAVTITLSKDSLQTLLDDLYDAYWQGRRSQNRPAGGGFRNLREVIEETTAVGKQARRLFEYEVVAPKADFYRPFLMPEAQAWRKLWQDAVWATLRGRPKARIPYQQRIDGKPIDLAAKVWADLTDRRRGSDRPTAVSEALFIGAQSETAEKVAYQGAAREALLLHFWPIVALVGQARQVKVERKQGRVLVTEEDVGYVFSVPDVSDVQRFIRDFERLISQLSGQLARDGYRPADAILALPQEGALEYLRHLFALARAQAERTTLRRSVTGIEVYQLAKRGNNVPILAVGRVEAEERLARDYESIRGGYSSPLFRAHLILNLLRGEPWFRGFDRLFDRHDGHLFVGDGSSAFAHDARAKFTLEMGAIPRGGADDA